METETLDNLYLEISQFTSARNSRELKLQALIKQALSHNHDDIVVNGQTGPRVSVRRILQSALELF